MYIQESYRTGKEGEFAHMASARTLLCCYGCILILHCDFAMDMGFRNIMTACRQNCTNL